MTECEEKQGAMEDSSAPKLTLVAKFGKERITLEDLSADTKIGEVKDQLQEITNILSKRQKLVGLVALKGGAKGVHDDLPLKELKVKGKSSPDDLIIVHQCILMGTPEEKIFVDPQHRDDLPDVVDDFDLDFNAGSHEWLQHVANKDNLKKFTEMTEVFIMNQPREGKPLMVLDLDHTLLDFSSKTLQQDLATHQVGHGMAAVMKRPHMDEFLCAVYQHYDLVVWSQTSWRWLETKLTELGMLTHPGYKFCFVLDKSSMFSITSTKRDGTSVKHQVKPLQLIWNKFPRWGSHNTVHIDDLARNFALNLSSGLKCKAYYRKKSKSRNDKELWGLSNYLVELGKAGRSFDDVDFDAWSDVLSGKSVMFKNGSSDEGDSKEADMEDDKEQGSS